MSPDRSTVPGLLALTFTTGVLDAVGYLGLGHVFAANQTGNIVLIGLGLADGMTTPLLGPAATLGAFAIGAYVAGRVLRHAAPGWAPGVSGLLAGVAGTVLAVAALVHALGPELAEPWRVAVTAVLGAAMGAQTAAARHVGVEDMTTVVVTSTLAKLVADAPGAGARPQLWVRRGAAVSMIAAGAVVGALAHRLGPAVGLWLAGAVVLSVAALATASRRRGG